MRRLRSAIALLTGLFRRREMESRLSHETRFHIDMATQRHVRSGLRPDEARRLALVEFGPRDAAVEGARDEYRSRHIEQLIQDARYFDAMGIAITSGRAFTAQDGVGTPKVGVISETLARTMFPGEDPIGRFLLYEWAEMERVEIVGVAADVHHDAVDKAPAMEIYRPLAQFPYSAMWMVARGSGDATTLAQPMRDAIRAVDPNVPLAQVRSLEAMVAESLGRSRLSTALFALFGGLGLVLAAVGIYGVMAHTVQLRRHEMGVRLALGASAGSVRALVVKRGAQLAIVGIVLGTLGAPVATRLMTKLLFDVRPGDPRTFLATAAILGAVALLASYLPARSATNVDPMRALRGE